MDTQQAQNFGAAMAGMAGIFMIIGLAAIAFAIFLFWRIFAKAGMAGSLSFLILIPGVGGLVALCIFAFADWKVVPVAAISAPPLYPPVS